MRIALWALVVFHMAVICLDVAALVVLPFRTPWYVSVPLLSWLVNLMFSPTPCPLTRLEDRIRKRLGMPPVRFFLGYYVVWPLKAWLRGSRRPA